MSSGGWSPRMREGRAVSQGSCRGLLANVRAPQEAPEVARTFTLLSNLKPARISTPMQVQCTAVAANQPSALFAVEGKRFSAAFQPVNLDQRAKAVIPDWVTAQFTNTAVEFLPFAEAQQLHRLS